MLSLYHDDLICDLAETYNIYDYRVLPVRTLAVLVSGLRDNSRIGQKLAGLKASPDTVLLAKIYDIANMLLWARTEDAQHGRNAPESLANNFIEDKKEFTGFKSGADFDKARAELLKRVKK